MLVKIHETGKMKDLCVIYPEQDLEKDLDYTPDFIRKAGGMGKGNIEKMGNTGFYMATMDVYKLWLNCCENEQKLVDRIEKLVMLSKEEDAGFTAEDVDLALQDAKNYYNNGENDITVYHTMANDALDEKFMKK